MGLYHITNDLLTELNSTSFQKENLWERRDLQRLLKANIGVIDKNVMIIAEEFSDWSEGSCRIDLLAIDREANLVVIELKRTNDGGYMELQAIRYAAMIANMTWEHAKLTFQKYLLENNLDYDAESKLCEFLGWEIPAEDNFAQNVKIILASANFSKDITNSVLWLNDRDLDIKCIRLLLYKISDKLVLNAEQIIPLPEAESYQIEARHKRREERVSRSEKKDRSLFSILYSNIPYEENFRKSDIGYFTVMLLEKYNMIDGEIFKFLCDDISCGFKLLKRKEEMTETEMRYSKYRFNKEAELIFEDKEYYVARNWGVNNVPKFIEKIKNKFPVISYLSTLTDFD